MEMQISCPNTIFVVLRSKNDVTLRMQVLSTRQEEKPASWPASFFDCVVWVAVVDLFPPLSTPQQQVTPDNQCNQYGK